MNTRVFKLSVMAVAIASSIQPMTSFAAEEDKATSEAESFVITGSRIKTST